MPTDKTPAPAAADDDARDGTETRRRAPRRRRDRTTRPPSTRRRPRPAIDAPTSRTSTPRPTRPSLVAASTDETGRPPGRHGDQPLDDAPAAPTSAAGRRRPVRRPGRSRRPRALHVADRRALRADQPSRARRRRTRDASRSSRPTPRRTASSPSPWPPSPRPSTRPAAGSGSARSCGAWSSPRSASGSLAWAAGVRHRPPAGDDRAARGRRHGPAGRLHRQRRPQRPPLTDRTTARRPRTRAPWRSSPRTSLVLRPWGREGGGSGVDVVVGAGGAVGRGRRDRVRVAHVVAAAGVGRDSPRAARQPCAAPSR